jgi:hypothetical protein
VIFWRAGRHINTHISEHGGWTTSVPGREIRFEALAGSPLPAQLAALGYIVEKTGTSQRILPHQVAPRFEVSSSGALMPVTEGSTMPVTVTVTVTKAGLAVVEQYDLRRATCGAASELVGVPRAFGGHFGVSGLLGQYLDLVKIQFLASASVAKSPM